ncbi:MAG TPA: DNA polymerase III subunit delta' [Rhodospirillaceae bacterium]|mgnify:CR=1 FL=1|nr:DNA polymerase III subunit delta' [Rhodospirillaceae bacterium]
MSDEADPDGGPDPRSNPDLIGHLAAEENLRGALEAGRLAHAWLITGPKGIGKATLAHRFARYVLAHGAEIVAARAAQEAAGPGLFGEELPAPEPIAEPGEGEGLYLDPAHPVFHRTLAGSHADLMVIQRAVDEKTGRLKGQITVDAIRAVKSFLSLTAGEGAWRVVVIDCADDMNRNAANALLKVLEEPPPQALVLLVSHNPGSLLPTIRSRCRRLTLRPPSTEAVAEILAKRCPDLASAEAARLAEVAEGSIGYALELAEQGGLAMLDEISGLFAKLPDGLPVKELHAFAVRVGGAGKEAEFDAFAKTLRWWLERLIVAGGGGPLPSLLDAGLVQRLNGMAGLDRWLEVWEKVSRLLKSTTAVNLDRKQAVLNAFITAEAAVRR